VRKSKPLLGLLALLLSMSAAASEPLQVTVNEAFINVHNGAGRGYPIFHVIERGEVITLLKSRTDWIKIETARGLQGWIQRSDIFATRGPDGNVPEFADTQRDDYLVDRFELGSAFGNFAGADAFHLNLGYRFTKNLSTELRLSQNTGEFADSQIVAITVLHQAFPEWPISPFIGLGAGTIKTTPATTLIHTEDRSDKLLQADIGLYTHISSRFFIRIEYSNNYILTSRNTNQEVNEWKVGFSVFF